MKINNVSVKNIGVLSLVAAGVLLSGCTQAVKYPPNTLTPVTQVVKETVTVPETSGAIEASYGFGNNPDLIRAYQVYRKTGKAPTVYTDGFMSFPYMMNQQPIIPCAPMQVCTIQFQEGELIKDVSIGDSANWLTHKMFIGGTWPNGAEVITFKPTVANIHTNMVVATDKGRLYQISLVSTTDDTDSEFTQAAQQAMAQENQTAQNVVVNATDVDLNNLNFNYAISGDSPVWKPLKAFDDGTHTFVVFPTAMDSNDLPVLYAYNNGDKQLLNWHKSGQYFVVDGVFKQLILISGVGHSQDQVFVTNSTLPS